MQILWCRSLLLAPAWLNVELWVWMLQLTSAVTLLHEWELCKGQCNPPWLGIFMHFSLRIVFLNTHASQLFLYFSNVKVYVVLENKYFKFYENLWTWKDFTEITYCGVLHKIRELASNRVTKNSKIFAFYTTRCQVIIRSSIRCYILLAFFHPDCPPHVVCCPSYFILTHPEGTLNLMFPGSYFITLIATVSSCWSLTLSSSTKDLDQSWVSPCLPSVAHRESDPLVFLPWYIWNIHLKQLTLSALKVVYLNSLPLYQHKTSSSFT